MDGPFFISLFGGACFALSAIMACTHLHRRTSVSLLLLRLSALLALFLNAVYLGWSLRLHGSVETFRQTYDSALLMAALVGLVGIGTHLSTALRGLDGFLFLIAALLDIGASAMIGERYAAPTYQRWFVSHGLAFAVSSACFVAGGATGVAYLLIHRMLRLKGGLSLVGSVPSLEALERFGRWTLAIGFPLFTYGMLTGVCGVWHRADIGRTAWYLDPSVLISLVVWLAYAYGLWALIFRPQLRGRRAAVLATCGMALVVIAIVVKDFVSPIHQ